MFKSSALRVSSVIRNALNQRSQVKLLAYGSARFMSKHNTETDAQFDQRYKSFFDNPCIDGWDIRRGVHDLWGHDLVPEPEILVSIFKACDRVKDLALAIRILEAVKDKCGNNVNEIYPWLMQELRPTLDELGIPTLEELGYDKPELHLANIDDM